MNNPESEELVTVFSPEQIANRVSDMGAAISSDYQKILAPGESLLVVGVLNGAFIFMADLVRALTIPVNLDFVRLSSYQDKTTSSTEVVMTKNLEKEVKDRHVLVVEDIADCGLTLAWLLDFIGRRQPGSLKVAVALDKTERREVPVKLDYVGFTINEGFLVGYGLDYADRYRELSGIYRLIPKTTNPAGH